MVAQLRQHDSGEQIQKQRNSEYKRKQQVPLKTKALK